MDIMSKIFEAIKNIELGSIIKADDLNIVKLDNRGANYGLIGC